MIVRDLDDWTPAMVCQFVASHDCLDDNLHLTNHDVTFLYEQLRAVGDSMIDFLTVELPKAVEREELSFHWQFAGKMKTLGMRVMQAQVWARHLYYKYLAEANQIVGRPLPSVRQLRSTQSSPDTPCESCIVC
jgi:hypothetical protein